MRKKLAVSRSLAALSAVLLVAVASVPSAIADKPPLIPAWYEGEIVYFTVVNENVDGRNAPQSDGVAIPFYAFGPPMAAPQFDVFGLAPGDAGYNPWWEVFVVIPTDGRDVSTNPFTTEQEILDAAAMGDVIIIDTGFVFLCQVLPGKNR